MVVEARYTNEFFHRIKLTIWGWIFVGGLILKFMDLASKIAFLEGYLALPQENYADSFKSDVIVYFEDDFSVSNAQLEFLETMTSEKEIEDWVDRLLSRFVMKFDGEFESEGDFIDDYLREG